MMKARWMRRWLAVIIVAGLAACGSPRERASEHVLKAQKLLAQGDQRSALIELKNALELTPQDAEVNFQLAKTLRSAGKLDDAAFYFKEASRLDPGRVDSRIEEARLSVFTDPERCKELIDEVQAIDPGSSNARVLRSTLFLKSKDVEKALGEALAAVELDPKNGRAQRAVGMVRKAQIKLAKRRGASISDTTYQQAVDAFSRAVSLLGDEDEDLSVTTWVSLATIYSAWPGHAKELLRTYQDAYQALRSDPAKAHKILQAALATGNAEALNKWAVERLIELEPGNIPAWSRLAQISGDDAEKVMDRMLAKRPDDAAAHGAYARFLTRQGRPEDGIAHLQSVIDHVSPREDALAALAQLQAAHRDLAGADETLRRLEADYPDTPATFQTEALIARARHDGAKAVKALTRWIDTSPSTEAFELLADTELARGNASAALDAANQALQRSSTNPLQRKALLRIRGLSAIELRDWNLALESFRKLKVISGQDAPQVARALYELGRPADGRKVLEAALAMPSYSIPTVVVYSRYEGKRHPERAKKLLLRAKRAHPRAIGVRKELVRIAMAKGDHAAALLEAEDAMRARPDSFQVHGMYARMLAINGRTDEAIQEATRSMERWPDQAGTAEMLYDLFTRSGRQDQALATLEKQHEAGKLNIGGRILLARMLNTRGRGDEANALLESVLAERPDQAAAANDLAFSLAQRGRDIDRALELAQVARNARPTSAPIADTLGFVFLKKGLDGPALAQFDDAVSLADASGGSWALAQFHRAQALRALGRKKEASEALEKALASGADFPGSDNARQMLQELSARDRGAEEPNG